MPFLRRLRLAALEQRGPKQDVRRLTRVIRWSDASIKHDVRRLTRVMRWSDASIKHDVTPLGK